MKEINAEVLYKNLKKRRRDVGLDQEELARMIGYGNRSSIAKIESGAVDLPYSKILAFSRALEIDPIDLMGLEPVDDYARPIIRRSRVRIPTGAPDKAVDLAVNGVFYSYKDNGILCYLETCAVAPSVAPYWFTPLKGKKAPTPGAVYIVSVYIYIIFIFVVGKTVYGFPVYGKPVYGV